MTKDDQASYAMALRIIGDLMVNSPELTALAAHSPIVRGMVDSWLVASVPGGIRSHGLNIGPIEFTEEEA